MADPLFDEMIQRAVEQYVQANPQAPAVQAPQKSDRMLGAHMAWLAPAAADIASTIYAQQHPELGLSERNPLVKGLPHNAQIPVGAGLEALAYFAGRKLLKDKHPKWFKAALFGAGAMHGKATLNNLMEIAAAKQDLKARGLDKLEYKDGYFYDPSAFLPRD